jgi:hypothetical protein
MLTVPRATDTGRKAPVQMFDAFVFDLTVTATEL